MCHSPFSNKKDWVRKHIDNVGEDSDFPFQRLEMVTQWIHLQIFSTYFSDFSVDSLPSQSPASVAHLSTLALDAGSREWPQPTACAAPMLTSTASPKRKENRGTETGRQKVNHLGFPPPGRAMQLYVWHNRTESINCHPFVLVSKRSVFVSMMLVPCRKKMEVSILSIKADKNANGLCQSCTGWPGPEQHPRVPLWSQKILFGP